MVIQCAVNGPLYKSTSDLRPVAFEDALQLRLFHKSADVSTTTCMMEKEPSKWLMC